MGSTLRSLDKVARYGGMGAALLRSTVTRPAGPLKLNFCLTYWCQYRCKTCNIWQRKPTDELTTAEVLTFIRENPDVSWVDLTGGEIFLRQDIDDIFEAVVTGWKRLALLHFPTNGFLTIGSSTVSKRSPGADLLRRSSPSASTVTNGQTMRSAGSKVVSDARSKHSTR